MEPETNKPRRARYTVDKGNPVEPDPAAYVKNLATERAKKVKAGNVSYTFEIWFDRHLNIRQQFGDENGPREGIGDEEIINLLNLSLPHIIYYALQVTSFSAMSNRICLRADMTEGLEPLNIICEIHFKDIKTHLYEITVTTAMCKRDFRIKDNQFSIELLEDGGSVLKRFYRGNFNEICSN